MSETELTPRIARRFDDAASVSEVNAAVEPAVKSSGRQGERASPLSGSYPIHRRNPAENQRQSFGANIPIERWFARFAVRVGGQIAWLTTCEQGRSLLFRYTSHFVILAVLIGAIGLLGTAKTTSASNLPGRQNNITRVINTSATISTTDDIIYNQFGQGGPIVVDQVNVLPSG